MGRVWWNWALITATSVFVLGMSWPHFRDLALLTFEWRQLGLLGCSHLIGRWLSAELLRCLLGSLNCQISRLESLAVIVVRESTGLLIPRGGAAAAGVYLQRAHRVALFDFGSMSVVAILIQVFLAGGLGTCVALVGWAEDAGPGMGLIAIFFAAVGTLAGGFLWSPVPKLLVVARRIPSWLRSRIESFLEVRAALVATRASSKRLMVLSVGLLLVRMCAFALAFSVMGVEVGRFEVALVSLSADLATFISLTPQGLGLREAIVVSSKAALGVSAAVALSGALVNRGAGVAINLLAAQLMILSVGKRFGSGSPAQPGIERGPSR